MTLAEVKELVKAGFTHDEIMSFEELEPVNTQVTTQEPELAVTPEVTKEPEPTDNPETLPNDQIQTLTASINQLVKTIQSSNLKLNSFEKKTTESLNDEVDKIMSNIIRPEKRKE